MSEWYTVNVGLSQGFVMSPWLFNMNMEVMERKEHAMVTATGEWWQV